MNEPSQHCLMRNLPYSSLFVWPIVMSDQIRVASQFVYLPVPADEHVCPCCVLGVSAAYCLPVQCLSASESLNVTLTITLIGFDDGYVDGY